MTNTLDKILEHKIVAILRGVEPVDVGNIVKALYEGGVRILELTMNSKGAIELIRRLNEEWKGKMEIGAGTVLTLDDAKRAKDAGATFLISPGLDVDVVHFTKNHGLVSIPGAFTATEVMNADRAGADIVKLFPCSGADYLKSIHAPLNRIRLMPTGGINAENIHEFAKAGAVAFGIGSALVQKSEKIDEFYFKRLTEKARVFVNAAAGS